MARKKKEETKEVFKKVMITLKGCSLYGKTGDVKAITEYGFKKIYTVLIDGKEHKINARFCIPLIENCGRPKTEKPKEAEKEEPEKASFSILIE